VGTPSRPSEPDRTAILAGDIGGTKVDLGLFSRGGGRAAPSLTRRERFSSASHEDLQSICRAFLGDSGSRPVAAAFGIAGPIVDDRVEATNLPWVIEKKGLESLLGCPVALLNDLESTAHGIPLLSGEELLSLNDGEEVPGAPRALIAAGTGLGQGYMVREAGSDRYLPCASEGGHSDFAARDEEEFALLRHLKTRLGRVSVERVVSGMGIESIFDYLAATGRYMVPDTLRRAVSGPDGAAVISKAALEGTSPVCVETMRRFISSYGAEAGNLALKIMALGGLYVGGGIAPKILPLMREGTFMRSFVDKGRFAGLMKRIPVRVILNERTALLGAAAAADRLAG